MRQQSRMKDCAVLDSLLPVPHLVGLNIAAAAAVVVVAVEWWEEGNITTRQQ